MSFTIGPLLTSDTVKNVYIPPFSKIFQPNADLIMAWLRNAGHVLVSTPQECSVQIMFLPRLGAVADMHTTPTILVSTEQPNYQRHDKDIITSAHTIWCMDVVDLNFLHVTYSVPLSKLVIVPVMLGTYVKSIEKALDAPIVHVLQFGCKHARRDRVMSLLQTEMSDHCIMNGEFTSEKVASLLQNTHIVLAMHYYEEPNVFSLHRIMNVMQYPHVRVIAEESIGSVYTRALMEQFGERIVIAKYEDLVPTCKKMLENDAECMHAEPPACLQKIYAWDGQTSWLHALDSFDTTMETSSIIRASSFMNTLTEHVINANFLDACKCVSDSNEHVDTIRMYASQCSSIVELATRTGPPTWGCLQGLIEKATSDATLEDVPYFTGVYVNSTLVCNGAVLTGTSLLKMNFLSGDVLKMTPIKTDMLFIDTFHVYGQLKRELALHAPTTRKFILLHDTTIDGEVGETIRNGWDPIAYSEKTGFPVNELLLGVWPAVVEFLNLNPNWSLLSRVSNNNGLTILRRDAADA